MGLKDRVEGKKWKIITSMGRCRIFKFKENTPPDEQITESKISIFLL